MSLRQLPDLALPEYHPLAGREAFQCSVCDGISYPPDPDKGCPYCNESEEDE